MSKRISRKAVLFVGGGSLALLLFLCSVTGLQAAGDQDKDKDKDKDDAEEAIVLETLDVEAQEETERTILDLEQSFEESFIREKVFSEQIERESISDVKAAIKAMPNVTIREIGGFSSTIAIRGLSGDRIISVIDGVRLSNQGLTYRGGGEINMIDIGTVDSIEVIKGSPSVIYDPGATGGIILVKTKPIAEEDHLSLKYRFGYDDGFEKAKHTISLSGAKRGFGAALSYSRTDAKGYKVRDKVKLHEVIDRANNSDEERTGSDRLTDLGFQDESLTLDLNYLINENHSLSFKHSSFEVEDSTSIIPAFRPTLFHLHFLSRESDQVRYQIKSLGRLQDIHLAIADQTLVREETENEAFFLDSQSANARGSFSIQNTKLTLGGEVVFDEATTQVLADQDSWAGYISAEHIQGKLTYTAGIRANRWELESEENPNNNSEDLSPLVGSTLDSESKEEAAFTYAGGLVYALSDNNKLSFNYSKTHRFPSLFERFADDDTFSGCRLDCKSEKSDNFEAAWKFYDGLFSASISIFYSDFENLLRTGIRDRGKNPANLIGRDALLKCLLNREREHPEESNAERLTQCQRAINAPRFRDIHKFRNFKRVVNQGFEVSLRRVREEDYEAGFSFGLSDFDIRSDFTGEFIEKTIPFNPLEFNAYYTRYFSVWKTKPWLKLQGRYVTNTPHVNQVPDGFSAFFVADLFGGFKYALHKHSDLMLNAGIRNLTDKIYHEPFSPLDGLKRTFFFNVSLELG